MEGEGGARLPIETAPVGTLIRTPTGFEPILGYLHAEDSPATYLRFSTSSGEAVSISKLHHLLVNGASADPLDVRLGDVLQTPRGGAAVTRIEAVQARGAYHPFVRGGTYYVDGIAATDYVALVPAAAWPAVRAYVGARFRLGAPIVPVGRGLFPNHAWAVSLLSWLGVPLALSRGLFPVTMACGIGTELVNALAAWACSFSLLGCE